MNAEHAAEGVVIVRGAADAFAQEISVRGCWRSPIAVQFT
jgi:hypothetical protein